ncbi:hypothetical protein CMI46_01560 [Candidatus Pacearchaeota archaeon]|nr:hypothetical protein [Candidatus Pacearchaeota archaeon]|tara:strand:- start:2559 stop:3167 length:609 start_codon:yes stop_codon:yes gene_type:complete
MEKKKLSLVLAMFMFIFLISNVYAITGKIGNGKMIVTLEEGEVLDRTIRVINDNDISLNITLFAAGDLVDDIEIIDESFVLAVGEEKRARFKLEAKEIGNYESRINVQFAPVEGGSGVGLSATVITKIVGEGSIPDGSDIDDDEEGGSSSSILILGMSSVLLVVVLGLLLYSAKTKPLKKVSKEDQEKKSVKRRELNDRRNE